MINSSRYASFDSKFGRSIGALRPLTFTIKESVPLKATVRTNPLPSLASYAVGVSRSQPLGLSRTYQRVPPTQGEFAVQSVHVRRLHLTVHFSDLTFFLSFDATAPDLTSGLWFPITATNISKSESPGCASQEFS
jgi:hypothetical protein